MALTQEEVDERLKNLTPEQMQELVRQQCLFCKIIAGEIPSYKIYEDNNFLAFLDINPINSGQVLVVPKMHISVLPQMPDQELAMFFSVVKRLAAKVFEITGAAGINILQNNGAVAGQVIPHVHVKIIPRFEDDGKNLERQEYIRKAEEAELKQIQEKLIKALGKPIPKEEKPAPQKEIKEKIKLPRVKSRLP